jgi:hypothetical protein
MATSPAAEVTTSVLLLAMTARTKTEIAAMIRNRPSAAWKASSGPFPNHESCPGSPAFGSVTYRLTPMPRQNWTISTITMDMLARREPARRDSRSRADGEAAD